MKQLLLAAILAGSSLAQQFEVASIRPTVIQTGAIDRPGPVRATIEYTADGLRASGYNLRTLLAEAYQLPASRVSLADSTYKDRSYEVAAKSPGPASPGEVRRMLQSFLTDRFALTLHREAKQEPVYRLTPRKGGVKLEKSTAESENARYLRRPEGLFYTDATAERFGDAVLSTYMQRRVLASSELTGLYHFPIPAGAAATEAGQDVFVDALQRVGLDLVPDRASIDYLVVDQAKPPSEN